MLSLPLRKIGVAKNWGGNMHAFRFLSGRLTVGLFCAAVVACGTKPIAPSDKHLQRKETKAPQNAQIPQTIKRIIPLAPPQTATKVETYSVVVTQVPAHEILFALARDAKINLDIHGGIQGNVTLNAINQTLPQILDRMAQQVDIRYELNGVNLVVMPDTPYLKHYKIDYINMGRDSEGTMSNSTQVGSGTSGSATGAGGTTSNNSSLTIKNTTKNNFWVTLTQNIKDILHETDKIFPAGSSETFLQQNNTISTSGTGNQAAGNKTPAKTTIENSVNPAILQTGGATVTRTNTFREAAAVIANPETGIITVRATSKQHEKIQEFVDQIMLSARRQVLIEATIVEVRLNNNYQQGIDWSRIRTTGGTGFNVRQIATGTQLAANTGSIFNLGYLNPASAIGNIAASITLLESFGNVKVLSSPKLSVMNNQTAMLRVVDNIVYFVINSTTSAPTANSGAFTTFTTTPNVIPVGFIMSVTPQINDNDTVLLNLRPSITRLLGFVNDPNPE
ncbi:MAG: type II and III secretion system protein, partial [Candidatus Nitrotoga sp.]